MPSTTFLSFCLFLLILPGWCFVDECKSLEPSGLRGRTENLSLDYSIVEPIKDKFRFYRQVREDGYVQYVSRIGLEALTIEGYVYDRGVDDWQLDVLLGNHPAAELQTILTVDTANLPQFHEEWRTPPATETKWKRFKISLSDQMRCPKVVEIWLRKNATGNATPGWALQVGRVRLVESLFSSCKIPDCLGYDSGKCFAALEGSELLPQNDPTQNFSKVFSASDNIVLDPSDAVASFSGDHHRFRRDNQSRGIVTYHVPEGIAKMEVSLFRCGRRDTEFLITPYVQPGCKRLNYTPPLRFDSYFSNCWRRFKATVDFRDFLDCPPLFVDLVLDGEATENLQISSVKIFGYGQMIQDPDFTPAQLPPEKERLSEGGVTDNVLLTGPEEDVGEGGGSVKLWHWLPATIAGGAVVFSILVGIALFRNGEVQDFIADYIEDNFPFIYKHFYPPEPPKSTPRATHGIHPHCNMPTESMNFSCTFDGNLKQRREPPAKGDVTATRDGFGEQLIDLSKHLQRSFWSSKVGKKNRVLEIEERLGKGGFGKVWKARWQGTPVALKVVPLHGNLRQEEKLARMAIMEAALSGCLAHPNIVSTYACEIREANDFDKEAEGLSVEDSQNKLKWTPIDRFHTTNASKNFMKNQTENDLEVRIIMEYCDRGSLVAAIKHGWFRNASDPLLPDFEAVILTALDIARGLYCLHENNIIHGDLKPHNVLLQNRPFVDSRGFIAKLADFGLSIKMESEQSHVDGMRMGTGGYVSPEVAVRGKILPASDVYSYGILLWELFTGELIQDAIKDAPKVSSRLTMGSWRPIFNEDCPQAYSRLASMCWNDFPDWRPTLEYIIDELNAMLKAQETAPQSAEPEPPQPPPSDGEDNTVAPTLALS